MFKKIMFLISAVLIWEGCKHAVQSSLLTAEDESDNGNYKSIKIDNPKNLDQILNDKKNNKWELISCFRTNELLCVFKKPQGSINPVQTGPRAD